MTPSPWSCGPRATRLPTWRASRSGSSDALVPAADVIPAGTIAALVTERGVLVPPSAPAIAELIASSEATAPIGPPETAG